MNTSKPNPNRTAEASTGRRCGRVSGGMVAHTTDLARRSAELSGLSERTRGQCRECVAHVTAKIVNSR